MHKPTATLLLLALAAGGCLPAFNLPAPDGGTAPDLAGPPPSLGAPTAPLFDAANNLTVDALIPTYAATSIVSFSAQTETLSMPMNHQSAQVPAAAFSSCGNCHLNIADGGGVYYPGNFHSSMANLLMPKPTTCADCHAASQPTGFVGPTATNPARTPPSGEMKHDAVVWNNGAPTTTKIVTADCSTCHAAPSQSSTATWTTGAGGAATVQFHPSLTNAAQSQPVSCVDCHANTRPNVVLTSANATLPATLQFDHTASSAQGDCSSCHATGASTQWTAWSGGRFHLSGSANPATCVPCHEGERPTSTAAWTSTTYKNSPFDYVTNAQGVKHGDGQDCATCHSGPGTGAWGGTQNWIGGTFNHAKTTVAGTTCIACHSTQRPDLQPGATAAGMATLLGFDHSINGTGDCFGCHQATVAANKYVNYYKAGTTTLPGGDWMGAVAYPGSTLISSATQFITITESTLNRSGPYNLVTSISSIAATLYNSMLHVSAQLPPTLNAGPTNMPDNTKCWHCHTNTNGTVTAYANGQYHSSLTNYTATPGGAVSPYPQPTSGCTDCHSPMRPVGIVEKAASELQPMDHHAQFTTTVTIGGVAVSAVDGIDCSTCHKSPGSTWTDGVFHANIGAAVPKDCTTCHYPLMADATKADLASGTNYKMQHKSGQITFQNCQTCHTGALAKATTTPLASTQFAGGALHGSVASQPTACVDCHSVSEPAANASTQSSVAYTLAAGGTTTNAAQWMNHGSSHVAGSDCVVCHAADARSAGSAWSKSDSFHAKMPSPSTCQECHGLGNGGGAVPGTKNNMPSGLTSSTTATTASNDSTTGVPAGTLDQLTHADVNVTGRDCNFCHIQVGVSTVSGVMGKEWAQAKFHVNFTSASPLTINGSTGRCSNCHMNVKPGPSFTAQDHSSYTNAAGTQDCSSCHSWPGTGTPTSPNWLGAVGGMPVYITVGGFAITQPPATTATTQKGITNLPHPTPSGTTTCTTCHASAAGGKPAKGYDHASTLISTDCGACHEAGSNLVGTVWNGSTSQSGGAGDTRPYTLTSLVAYRGGSGLTVTYKNHFYPVDCNQCHVAPSGIATVTTGSAYLGASGTGAWTFPHNQTRMTNPTTCVMCHTNGIPN